MTSPAMPGQWDFSPVGYPTGAVMYTGPMLFPAGIDPGETKTGVIVLGPAGGVINVPPLAAGEPGPPPQFRSLTVESVPFGEPLPTPSSQITLVSPGGPGVASVYDLVIYLNEGAPGQNGQPGNIVDAPDVSGAPPDGGVMFWNSVTNLFDWIPGAIISTLLGIFGISTPHTNTTTRTIGTIQVPAQPGPWWPEVSGQAIISGTPNVAINLTATMNNTVIGRGWWPGGQGIFPITITPDLSASSAAVVPAGQTATIVFTASQTDASGDPWSTTQAQAMFGVKTVSVAP